MTFMLSITNKPTMLNVCMLIVVMLNVVAPQVRPNPTKLSSARNLRKDLRNESRNLNGLRNCWSKFRRKEF